MRKFFSFAVITALLLAFTSCNKYPLYPSFWESENFQLNFRETSVSIVHYYIGGSKDYTGYYTYDKPNITIIFGDENWKGTVDGETMVLKDQNNKTYIFTKQW